MQKKVEGWFFSWKGLLMEALALHIILLLQEVPLFSKGVSNVFVFGQYNTSSFKNLQTPKVMKG